MISYLLTIVLIVALFPVSAKNEVISENDYVVTEDTRIAPDLYEKAEPKDGRYLVYLQNVAISVEELYKEIENQTRFDPSIYETEEFYTRVVPELEQQIEIDRAPNQVQSPLEAQELGSLDDTTLDEAIQSEMNSYVSAKRKIIKQLNNVEVIEYVVNTAGTYSIEVYVDALTQTSTCVLMDRTVAWYIEPAS